MPFIVGTNKFVFAPSFFAVVTSVLPGPGAAAVAKAKIRPLIGFSFFWHLICVLFRGHPHVFPVSNHPEPLPCMVWLGKRVTQLNFFARKLAQNSLVRLVGQCSNPCYWYHTSSQTRRPEPCFSKNGGSGFSNRAEGFLAFTLQRAAEPCKWRGKNKRRDFFARRFSGSTISTLLHDKINPKNFQVLSLGDTGFLQFFRVVSRDYGKPRFSLIVMMVLLWWTVLKCLMLVTTMILDRFQEQVHDDNDDNKDHIDHLSMTWMMVNYDVDDFLVSLM